MSVRGHRTPQGRMCWTPQITGTGQTAGGLVSHGQSSLTVLEAAGPRPGHGPIQALARSYVLVPSRHFLPVSPNDGKGEGTLWHLFSKGTDPTHGGATELPPPHMITLRVRTQGTSLRRTQSTRRVAGPAWEVDRADPPH